MSRASTPLREAASDSECDYRSPFTVATTTSGNGAAREEEEEEETGQPSAVTKRAPPVAPNAADPAAKAAPKSQ